MSAPQKIRCRPLEARLARFMDMAAFRPALGAQSKERAEKLRNRRVDAERRAKAVVRFVAKDGNATRMIRASEAHRAANGVGPAPELVLLRDAVAAIGDLIDEIDDIVSNSAGVAGFHLSGAVAQWGEFAQFSEKLEDARAKRAALAAMIGEKKNG